MSPTPRRSTARLSGSSTALSAFPTQQRLRRTRAAIAALDFTIVVVAVLIGYLVRFEGRIPSSHYQQMLTLAPVLGIARVLVNRLFGVYRLVWRYVGLLEAFRMAQAVALVSTVLLFFRLGLSQTLPQASYSLSIIVLEGTLSFLGMAGIRFVPRLLRERNLSVEGTPALLIGAGQAGLAIVKEAARHPELGLRPVGFLDDDPTKLGMEIGNLRVLGALRDLDGVLEGSGAGIVIISSAAFSAKTIGRVMDACNPRGVAVKIVRGTYEKLGAEAEAEADGAARSMREVRIEDLLSRDPVPPSLSLADLGRQYGGKRVMVTGAGGSIGAELCRQLARMQPELLILAERDETNLFEIERELMQARLGHLVQPLLLDVMDAKAVERAFKDLQPHVVFHAAAYKHVPMMERFPWEAVRNNVFATKTLIDLADESGVERFVMISTDKAINPTSVMGATKRLSEQIVQAKAASSRTRFSCVRFGNVLGSRGSVVGIFREQIAAGGPVTVTHPEATRYFMTIPEAANLVIQAGTLGDRGEVFLLDMGEPVKIIDLARQMIRLSGYTEEEIGIKIVGTRAGEKLFEELSTTRENLAPTELRKIFRCRPTPVEANRIEPLIEQLQFLVRGRDGAAVRALLCDLDIGYQPPPVRNSDRS